MSMSFVSCYSLLDTIYLQAASLDFKEIDIFIKFYKKNNTIQYSLLYLGIGVGAGS